MFDQGAFVDALRELKINDKIFINTLTTIAHENIKYFSFVVEAIENRIKSAQGSMKLTALYLMDSIIKNVGREYIDEFGKNILGIFMEAYGTVTEEREKASYVKLARTWGPVKEIERRIDGGGKSHVISSSVMNQNLNDRNTGKPQNTQDLLREINTTIESQGRDLFKRPDVQAQLKQLEKVLKPGMGDNSVPSSPTTLLNRVQQSVSGFTTLDSAVQDLYSLLPFQCKRCAQRFKKEVLLKKHSDRHRDGHKKKLVLSRKWFQTADDWKTDSEQYIFENPDLLSKNDKSDEVEDEEVFVIADESQTHCPICKEKFDKIYDAKTNEWLYKGAVVDPRSNMITHKGCVFEEAPTKKKKIE